jgi:hypothetical protein
MSKQTVLILSAFICLFASCSAPTVAVKTEIRETTHTLDNFRVLLVSFDTELSKDFTPLFNKRLAKGLKEYGACIEHINIPYNANRKVRLSADSLQNNFKPEYILTVKIIEQKSNPTLNAIKKDKIFNEAVYYFELKSSITEKPVWTSQATLNNIKTGEDTKTIYQLTKTLLSKMEEDLIIDNKLKNVHTLVE